MRYHRKFCFSYRIDNSHFIIGKHKVFAFVNVANVEVILFRTLGAFGKIYLSVAHAIRRTIILVKWHNIVEPLWCEIRHAILVASGNFTAVIKKI